jgi:2-C-methyl-D-erythritol 4-phosphate cytidylyltransferase
LSDAAVYAVVPAAGHGLRMGAAIPKQYLLLNGRSVLEHTLERLARHPRIERVVVAIAEDDVRFDAMRDNLPESVVAVRGGVERCHSVLAGLDWLSTRVPAEAWIMVHDAARPCLRASDIDRMLHDLEETSGGILASPVRDTLKRCDADDRVTETVDRRSMWHALTPQMFRLQALLSAIEAAVADGIVVTDEAQAMELQGVMPKVIPGHGDNVKISYPEDLALAELILQAQGEPRA